MTSWIYIPQNHYKVWLGEHRKREQDLIADSGLYIALISQGTLNQMENPPKIQTGQKVNLVQVTGTSKISGYVNLPITFETDSRPIQRDVEACGQRDYYSGYPRK